MTNQKVLCATMRNILLTVLLVAASFAANGCASSKAMLTPDTIFHDGNIYTLNPITPRASAIAIKDGRIVAVGSDQSVLALAGPQTRRISLAGRTVTPGLIDAHAHTTLLGVVKTGRLDLADTKSFEKVCNLVEQRIAQAKPGEWIRGSLWDNANWGQKEFPTHERLSAISAGNPVCLRRNDGHMILANRKAMELAGITRDTKNPPGGEILRDANGDATGLFVDNAIDLITRMIDGGGNITDEILATQAACLAVGLTGLHDAGVSPVEIESYRRLCDTGQLKIRVYAMMDASMALDHMKKHKPLIGYGDGRFTLRAVKCFIDGAMSTRGAWLFEPYSDRPGYVGFPVQDLDWIAKITQASLAAGYQMCIHAIGDRGIHETLNVYEKVAAQYPGNDHRLRIEHAQNPAVSDIRRFASLGVIPAMQPTHATSDMRWAEDRVGPERVKGAYAWGKFLRAGCRIAAGSDFPVEEENPLWGIYAAVTRQDNDGNPPGGWYPDECMTREEAFRSFTIDAAYAAFEEDAKGSLEVGKLADLVVFDRDVMQCPARELITTKVVTTIIGGEVVYQLNDK